MQIFTFLLMCAMLTATSEAFSKPDDTKIQLSVIEILDPKLKLFAAYDGAQIGERLRNEVPLPLHILEQNGYRIKIELLGKPFWIRQNQVRTNRVIELRADCSPGGGNAKGKTVMATRGLGEECK